MFGLYIHIPYCLQRCSYCDFATYVYDQIIPPEDYVALLVQELKLKTSLFPQTLLTSIYFGGGTPSLLSSDLILSLLAEIAKAGLVINSNTEITLEINPATLDIPKINELLRGGVNRFSVGAQTFKPELLSAAGRKHSREDTLQTLDLLQSKNINYSFDLLFALPKQTPYDLQEDLKIISAYSPPHLSAYCLTVPSGHPMSFHRAPEEEQVEMFQMIKSSLNSIGLERYEISNFAKPNFESRHNLLYWQDQPYLSLGLSAHSYLKHLSPWGDRFWNPSSIEAYRDFILSAPHNYLSALQKNNCSETLSVEDSLFDFCHTSLRLDAGLKKSALKQKYAHSDWQGMEKKLMTLVERNLVSFINETWKLSADGLLVSNSVFAFLS